MAGQCDCPIRIYAIELGQSQPQTQKPTYTENSTARGIFTTSMLQNLLKAFNMHFYWMHSRIRQRKFDPV